MLAAGTEGGSKVDLEPGFRLICTWEFSRVRVAAHKQLTRDPSVVPLPAAEREARLRSAPLRQSRRPLRNRPQWRRRSSSDQSSKQDLDGKLQDARVAVCASQSAEGRIGDSRIGLAEVSPVGHIEGFKA